MTDSKSEYQSNFLKVESIFLQLCNLDSSQQEEQIDELCDNDPGLIKQVRAMLNADQETSPVLDPDRLSIDEPIQESVPESIGKYSIVGVLGEGGMGIVYEAIQDSPKRRVALKIIKERSLHAKIKKRFQSEADILAKLNHPGIATIYESGVAESDGRSIPYVAIELVDGVSISAYCKEHELDVDKRVSLLSDVCRAVGHAHALGIVHRDLKPGNILVDSTGHPKVLDFGIAIDTQIDQRTQITQTGQLLGTLQYMAPEQVDRGENALQHPQTDVYALALIGYELLVGHNPIGGEGSSLYEMIRAIREDEPDYLGTHDRTLRGDLETIIAKALSHDLDRRYVDANMFADDLDRYLNRQPILARKQSTWYQIRKFTQRNPLVAGSISALIIVLFSALLLISLALKQATKDRRIAIQEQRTQELINTFVTDDLFATGNPDYDGDADVSLLDAMRRSSDAIAERFADAPEAEASIRFTMGDQFRLMSDYDQALVHLNRCVELSETIDIPIDELIDRRNSLSDVYMDIDDLDTALALVLETNALAESSDEVSPEIMIDTLVQHASLLYHMRDNDGAAPLFERAVEIGRAQAPEYPGTVDAISALATVYTRLDRFDESIELHHEGIELRIQTLGPEHPATLVARDNLAILHAKQGEFPMAIELLEEVLVIRQRVFGNDHVKTHLTRGMLGRSLSFNGDFARGEPLLLMSFQGLQEMLGDEHRYTNVLRRFAYEMYTHEGMSEQALRYAPLDSQ
jgi:eukaryotic-like serine/threonine-protein kinase